MVTKSPFDIGFAAAPGTLPAGAANAPVVALVTAPCPLPLLLSVKMPGANCAKDTVAVELVPAADVNVACARCGPASSHGIWILVCPLAAKNIGAAIAPLNCTLLLESVVGSGNVEAAPV